MNRELLFEVLLPTHKCLSTCINKLTVQASNGDFCLLPKHIDFISDVVPGVAVYWDLNLDQERYIAVDHGVLVKCDRVVTISTWDAISSDDLAQLEADVDQHFLTLDEQERKARTALARLETATLRSFKTLQERLHE